MEKRVSRNSNSLIRYRILPQAESSHKQNQATSRNPDRQAIHEVRRNTGSGWESIFQGWANSKQYSSILGGGDVS